MTLEEALNELREIAKGEYCTIRYNVTWYKNGVKKVEIDAYIDGYSFTKTFDNFKDVLKNMQERINERNEIIHPVKIADISDNQ